jgi:hypothetical protein
MTARLSQQDYELLGELKAGPRTISGNRPRDGADRLVAAGYATSRNLNVSVVEYEITTLGKIALVLMSHGVVSTNFSCEPHRRDDDGLWYLKVASPGNPTNLMSIGMATKLVAHLRAIGADDVANRVERETERVRRFALQKFAS